jgi:hypothetical protein
MGARSLTGAEVAASGARSRSISCRILAGSSLSYGFGAAIFTLSSPRGAADAGGNDTANPRAKTTLATAYLSMIFPISVVLPRGALSLKLTGDGRAVWICGLTG